MPEALHHLFICLSNINVRGLYARRRGRRLADQQWLAHLAIVSVIIGSNLVGVDGLFRVGGKP